MAGAPGSAGRAAPLRGGAEPPAAGPAVLPARHTAKLSLGSRGAASTGGRAGRCALRPPSRCLPPSACLRGPARRGAPCEEGEAEAGPFSPLSLLPAAAAARLVRAPKSLAASPGAGALARSPTGTRRRAGRERAGGGRVPVPGRDTVQSLPRSSSLCPLFFYSPRFFSQGGKKAAQSP